MARLGAPAGGRDDLRRRRDADPARRPPARSPARDASAAGFLWPPGGEWTVEANPGTLDAEKVDVLAAGGVNRVSLGAPSFRPGSLKALERNHDPTRSPRPRLDPPAVPALVARPDLRRPRLDARATGRPTWRRRWRSSPSHLSCYGLVYEKGTPLEAVERRPVRAVDEESERAMYEHTIDRLAPAGLAMYEISNFARPGHESRHNLVYWANDAYFGVGLGAARYVDGVRSVEHPRPAGLPPPDRSGRAGDRPDRDARPRGPRPGDGRPDAPPDRPGDRPRGLRRGPASTSTPWPARLARYVARGLLEDDGRRIRFTREGLFLADTVLCDLV